MDLDLLENIEEKNPKVLAELFFEKYPYDEIEGILKKIQKKIIEKNNSLKLMLSQRYVDLLDCSELIQELKKYSSQISDIAKSNENAIKASLEAVTQSGSKVQEQHVRELRKSINYQYLMEIVARSGSGLTFVEKIRLLTTYRKQIIAYLILKDAQEPLQQATLNKLLVEQIDRSLFEFKNSQDSVYEYQGIKISGLFVAMSIALPLFNNEGPNPQIFLTKAFKYLLTEDIVAELKDVHEKCLASGIWTDFIIKLLLNVIGSNLKDLTVGDSSLVLWINLAHTLLRVLTVSEKPLLNSCAEAVHEKLNSKFRYPQKSVDYVLIPHEKQQETLDSAKETIRKFYRDNFKYIQALIERQNEKSFNYQFYYLFLFDKEQSLALNELTTLTEEPIRPQIEELYQIQWKRYSENHLMEIFSHVNIDETVDILHKRLLKYQDGEFRVHKSMKEVQDRITDTIEKHTRNKWRHSLEQFNDFFSKIMNNDYMKLIGESSQLETQLKSLLEVQRQKIIEKYIYLISGLFAEFSLKEISFSILFACTFIEYLSHGLLKDISDKHHAHNFEGWFKGTVEEMYSILVSNIERDWPKIEEKPKGKRIFLDKFNRMLLELPHSAKNSEFLQRLQTKITEKAALSEDELKENFVLNYSYLSDTIKQDYLNIDYNQAHKEKSSINLSKAYFLDKIEAEPSDIALSCSFVPLPKRKRDTASALRNVRPAARPAENRNVSDVAAEGLGMASDQLEHLTEKALNNIVGGVLKLFK